MTSDRLLACRLNFDWDFRAGRSSCCRLSCSGWSSDEALVIAMIIGAFPRM
jgi:hypothetical protein